MKSVGPENHEREAVRGKPVEISFTVEQVQRIIPATEESLVQNFGFEDVDQLKQSLKMRLEQRVMVEQQSAMRQQVARHLLESVEFELPEKLTEGQASRNIQRAQMEMQYRGMDENTIEERVAEMRSSSKDVAQRELKLFFILNKVAEEMEVQVTEEEIYGRIAQMAALSDVWSDAAGRTLDLHITEWNVQKRGIHEPSASYWQSNSSWDVSAEWVETANFGMKQLAPMLEMVSAFNMAGVDAAQVWSVMYNAAALGMQHNGGTLTAAGGLFALMQDILPGTHYLEVAAEQQDADVHVFRGDGQTHVFVSLRSADPHNVTF